MKFKELAWGAFVFKNGYGDAYDYQERASDRAFLNRLRSEPSKAEFQRLRDFLVHYGVPWASKRLAQQYKSVWPSLRPFIQELSTERLETCIFEEPRIQEKIVAVFDTLLKKTWGKETVVSKVLHLFNTDLFVMVDRPIMKKYKKTGSHGYVEFLKEMQKEACELLQDFIQLGLPGTPHKHLSRMLGYETVRPLTKLIDDYNWVTITKRWPKTPPDWLLDLFVATKDRSNPLG
jgi:hypothetical protein